MLPALLDELMWHAPTRRPRDTRIAHLIAVGNDLAAALHEASGERASALRDRVQSLDDTRLLRILGAPEVCRMSVEPVTDAMLDQLAEWLDVEDALAEGRDKLERPGWSALGDRFVTGPIATTDDWGVADSYTAPTARAGIVLDFVSPAARRTPKSNEHRTIKMETPIPMSADDRRITIAKLDAALGALGELCRPAYEFVTALTCVIQPRKDSKHPDCYTSASIRTMIGRTALNNPQLSTISTAAIVSSLVHEAIHSYIYTLERDHVLVTDWDRAFDVEAISPWTGSVLSLPTYIHACFVWYGLRRLWNVPALARHFHESDAQRARAACGFARNVLEPLGAARELIGAEFRELLERMSHDN